MDSGPGTPEESLRCLSCRAAAARAARGAPPTLCFACQSAYLAGHGWGGGGVPTDLVRPLQALLSEWSARLRLLRRLSRLASRRGHGFVLDSCTSEALHLRRRLLALRRLLRVV